MRRLSLVQWSLALAGASVILVLIAVVVGVREVGLGVGVGLGTLWAALVAACVKRARLRSRG